MRIQHSIMAINAYRSYNNFALVKTAEGVLQLLQVRISSFSPDKRKTSADPDYPMGGAQSRPYRFLSPPCAGMMTHTSLSAPPVGETLREVCVV